MKIYLIQHGQSNNSKIDPSEGLTDEGKKNITNTAKALKKLNVTFDVIISSTKKRAIMTANLIQEVLEMNKDELVQTDKIKAMTPVNESIAFLQQFSDKKSVLLVGHLPSLHEIAQKLLSTLPLKINISNGSCLCIDSDNINTSDGILHWFMTNEQMSLLT